MSREIRMKQYDKILGCMDNLQNAVVFGGSSPSNEHLIQEWAPTLTNQNHEISPVESFDTRTNIVQTFDIPTTDQLRYGGDLKLKIGNKIEGFLELLQKGVVFGDGDWSEIEICGNSTLQEIVLEQPDKLNQLHCEFLEAGSDVLQALSFCPTMTGNADNHEVKKLNEISSEIVCKIASEHDAFVAGAICPSGDYLKGCDKEHVQTHFKQQMEVFNNCKVDVFLCNMYAVEETEWALEVMKNSAIPIAVTLCVDKLGTVSGTSLGDCAIKMARAGADVVGICCKFDGESPEIITGYVEVMRAALDRVGLQRCIMACPHDSSLPNNQHHCHDHKSFKSEPLKQCVMDKYARALYGAGVRFFRAGCGLGTSYIQHLSNELVKERAKIPINIKPSRLVTMDQSNKKGSKQYWSSIISPSNIGTTFSLPESA